MLKTIPGINYRFGRPGEEPPKGAFHAHQIHSTIVFQVDNLANARIDADGLITKTFIPLAIQTADCMPILFSSRDGKTVAAIHAGWRGLLNGILYETMKCFKAFTIKPSDVFCAIGPCIGPCCFEVGPEVIEKFNNHSESNHLNRLNLPEIATHQLMSFDIPREQIENLKMCTYCSLEHFESHRRSTHQNKKAGRQWSWISIACPELQR